MQKALKKEDDNPRQFESLVQISKYQKCQSLIGPELQCSQVYYFLQKGSE